MNETSRNGTVASRGSSERSPNAGGRWLVINRVSDPRQAEGASLETQLEECRRYVESEGGEVVDEITHVGSGLEPQEFYERIRASVERNAIARVIAWKFDRYGRDEAEAHGLISWFLKRGIEPESATEGRVPPFMRSLFIGLAAQESRNISARVRPNMRRRAEQGRWQGIAPVGFVSVDAPDGGKMLAHDPLTAPLVESLFHVADQTRSRRAPIEFAKTHGLRSKKTPTGKTLSWTGIAHILQNRVYLGEVIYGRRQESKIDELKARNGPQPESKWVVRKNAHPALIDEATFQRVNDWLDSNKTRKSYEKTNFYLLEGLVQCGRCGSPMRGCKTVTKGSVYLSYFCKNRHDFYACDQPKFSCRRLDEEIKSLLLETFLALVDESPNVVLDSISLLIERKEALSNTFGIRKRQLERRQDEIKLMRRNLLDKALLLDCFTRDELEERHQELNEELKAIEQELASLRPIEEQVEDTRAALAWLERLRADVERYGVFNQVELTVAGGDWALEVGPVDDRQFLMPLDDATWHRIARMFIRRVTLEGPTRGGTVKVEWSAEAESLLAENDQVVQLERKVSRM